MRRDISHTRIWWLRILQLEIYKAPSNFKEWSKEQLIREIICAYRVNLGSLQETMQLGQIITISNNPLISIQIMLNLRISILKWGHYPIISIQAMPTLLKLLISTLIMLKLRISILKWGHYPIISIQAMPTLLNLLISTNKWGNNSRITAMPLRSRKNKDFEHLHSIHYKF
jgi:hypothetical protein